MALRPDSYPPSEINADPERYSSSPQSSSMKRTILLLFILLAIGPAGAGQVSFEDKMAIREKVAKWNSALHISTIDQLNSLYAPTVLCNGKPRTKETCIKEKSNL